MSVTQTVMTRGLRGVGVPDIFHPTAMELAGSVIDLVDESTALDVISHASHRPGGPALAVASANLDHLHHFGTGGGSWGTAMIDTGDLHWMTLLDGAPLVSRAQRVTGVAWPRLAGADLLWPVLERAADEGVPVGFLGGTEPTLTLLRARLQERLPHLVLAGTWSPARSVVQSRHESDRLADEVRASGARILVVGLGKPRQEQWMQEHGARTGAGVLLAFGAAADFIAGTSVRAPEWMQRDGVEWAYRLASEPARLRRRYLVEGPRAMRRLVSDRRYRRLTERVTSTRRITSVGVVVVTHDSERELPRLLESLPAAAGHLRVEVVVVDNASRDRSCEVAREAGATVVATGANLGFAAGINVAVQHLAGDPDAVAILNPDVVLRPGALVELAAALTDPAVGVAVPQVLDTDGTRFPSLRRDTTLPSAVGDALFGSRLRGRPSTLSDIEWDEAAYAVPHDVDWASGAAWLVAADCAALVGPWNEEYFLYSEEAEYARRVRRAGYRLRYVPTAVVTHVGGASGRSTELDLLRSVNRIRDYRSTHGALAGIAFRGVSVLHHALRSASPVDREIAKRLVEPGELPAPPVAGPLG